MTAPLKVAINAQLSSTMISGVIRVMTGLIHTLGQLSDGDEQYTIITAPGDSDWVKPFLGANQRVVEPTTGELPTLRSRSNPLRPLALKARQIGRRFLGVSDPPLQVPYSNGFYESLGCDLIHFPYQRFTITALPFIYQPWDLQHRHYPQFFTPADVAWREVLYRTGCSMAQRVVVSAAYTGHDVHESYGVPLRRIHHIPLGSPLHSYHRTASDPAAVLRQYQITAPFALYPAQTWAHKNHLRLLEAIALLRDRDGLRVNVVCTGVKTDFWETIAAALTRLRLEDQVRFLGQVPEDDLRALYEQADFLVFPSLFEGFGIPPLEAWQAGKAVASSSAASLAELVGDAGLLFDPFSVEAIADAVKRLATSPDLRAEYARRGAARLRTFDWTLCARRFRALYRSVGGRSLSDEDRALLEGTLSWV